jgi:IclR family transcriptional regulator, pca regulon regulatory protein
MTIKADDRDFVSALERGLRVIGAFADDSEALTLSEIAVKSNLTRGTTRRLLLTLESLGYAHFDGKDFRLTSKVLNLGYAYLSSLPMWKVAEPVMKAVVDDLNESCSLGVLDGQHIVYVARVRPKHLSFAPINVGTRMPAHSNAMGQVLLAELTPNELDDYFRNTKFEKFTKYTPTSEPTIRRTICRVARDGYALSDQMLEVGRRAIAVPIRSRTGKAEMALNIGAATSRASKNDLITRFLPRLREAAQQLAVQR